MTEHPQIDQTRADQVPVVSACIITFNQRPYIERCLDGALAQRTTFPIEIVVYDDCSTDGTREICREYQRRHPERIRLILPAENQYSQGVRTSLLAFEPARGEFLALCEGDDYWCDPGKLQIQAELLQSRNHLSAVHHKVLYVDSKNRNLGSSNKIEANREIDYRYLATLNPIHSCSLIFRRSALTDTVRDLIARSPYGDFPLFLGLSNSGAIKYLDSPMASYRQRVGVMSRWTAVDGYTMRIEILERFLDSNLTEMAPWVRTSLRFQHYRRCIAALRDGYHRVARTSYLQMLALTLGSNPPLPGSLEIPNKQYATLAAKCIPGVLPLWEASEPLRRRLNGTRSL